MSWTGPKVDLAIVGAGPNQMPLILAAKEAGLNIITVDGSIDRIGHAFSAAGPVIVDLLDRDSVAQICSFYKVRGVASIGSDLGAQVAEYCIKKNYADAHIASPRHINKIEQLQLLEPMMVAVPRYIVVDRKSHRLDSLTQLAVRWGGRLVIKPAAKWGSLGVTIVQVQDDGVKFRNELSSAIGLAQEFDSEGQALVEEFLEGDELGVAASVEEGQLIEMGITRKLKLADDWRSHGHFPISSWRDGKFKGDSFAGRSATVSSVKSIIKASLPATSFSLDVDVIVSSGVPYVLEFAYRIGGNCIGMVCDEYLGTSLLPTVIQRSLREVDGNQQLRIVGRRVSAPANPSTRSVSIASPQFILARSMASGYKLVRPGYIFLESLSIRSESVVLAGVNSCLSVLNVPVEVSFDAFCREILPGLVSIED